MKKNTLLFLYLFTSLVFYESTLAQEYLPLGINSSGFNEDVIANGVGPAIESTTERLDLDVFNFLSLDFKANASSPNSSVGLPVNGLINAANIEGLQFQLQPYDQNNSLRIIDTGASGTLVLSNSISMTKLYLLATAGNAGSIPVTIRATINFSDNTSQVVTGLTVPDWYGGTVGVTAIAGIGRIDAYTNNIETPFNNPRLFTVEVNLDVSNFTKAVVSIDIAKTSSARGALNVFAATTLTSPDCFTPGAVTVDDVSTNGVSFSWLTAVSVPGLGYEFEIRSSGTPGSGSSGLALTGTVANTVLSQVISDLQPSTAYTIYIRSRCNAGSVSEWIRGAVFRTLCDFSLVSTTPATICGRGSVDLAASTAEGELKWFNREFDGSYLGSGTTYTTPVIDATTSYWVSSHRFASSQSRVGKSVPVSNAFAGTNVNWGIEFDLEESVFLETVDVYSSSSGNIDIKLTNAQGDELYSTGVVSVVDGGRTTPNVISLNFDVPRGNGYRLVIKSNSGATLYRDTTAENYPFTDTSGIFRILNSSSAGSPTVNNYYYFYNIGFRQTCVSPRKEVVVSVTPAPNLTLSTSVAFVCGGDTTERVTITEGATVYDTYSWSPSTGVSGNELEGWVFKPSEEVTYTLTASQSGGQVCQVIKTLVVKIGATPEVNFIPELDITGVCRASIVPLEVTYESNNTIQVGTDRPTSFDANRSAFNNYRASARVQLLFTAAELRSLGLRVGPISSIEFEVITLGANANNANYTVKIAPTNLVAYNAAVFVEDNLETVFFRDVYTHTASGWQHIIFDTPYQWDGVKNLIFEISHDGANSYSSASTLYTITPDDTVVFGYNGANVALSKNRFNIKLRQNFVYRVNWASDEGNLYLDEAANVPYIAGNARRIFFKPLREGLNRATATVYLGGCSIEKVFNVTTVAVPQPEVEDNQIFCGQRRVLDLIAEGVDLKWYRQADDGQPLDDTTVLDAGTYYVTQSIDGCESVPKISRVSFLNQPRPVVYSRNYFCGEVYLADLDVRIDQGNTLTWYDNNENLISTNIRLVSGIYYVAQSNGYCESERVQLNLNVNSVPPAPNVSSLEVCGEATVSDLILQLMPGATPNLYYDDNSNVAMEGEELLSTRTYYLSQTFAGCESAKVQVNITNYLAVPTPTVGDQDFCAYATVANLEVSTVSGAIVHWYDVPFGGEELFYNQPLSRGYYYVSQQLGSCESPRVRITVNVVQNLVIPVIAVQNFCGQATVSQLRVNLPVEVVPKWYTQETDGEALENDTELESGWYFVSQSLYGCESSRARVEVVINDIPQRPTGEVIQEFENGAIVNDLVTDQPNVVWYPSIADATNQRNRLLGDIPLVEGNVYYGTIISDQGCSSIPIAVTVKMTLGTNNFDLKNLHYYPNPVTDVLTLTYNEVITKVELYSVSGQRLVDLNTSEYTVELDMTAFAKSSYIVKIYTAAKIQSIKIIKK